MVAEAAVASDPAALHAAEFAAVALPQPHPRKAAVAEVDAADAGKEIRTLPAAQDQVAAVMVPDALAAAAVVEIVAAEVALEPSPHSPWPTKRSRSSSAKT